VGLESGGWLVREMGVGKERDGWLIG
jgi:hypothetical protein